MGLRTTSNQQRRRLWFVISVIELNKNYGHFFISSTVDRNDYGVCELWNGFSSFHVYRYGAAIWKTDTLLNYTDIHLKRKSSIVYWNIHGNCLWKWSAQCFFRFSHRNCQYYSSSFSSSIFSVQCLSIFRSVYCYLLIVDTDSCLTPSRESLSNYLMALCVLDELACWNIEIRRQEAICYIFPYSHMVFDIVIQQPDDHRQNVWLQFGVRV